MDRLLPLVVEWSDLRSEVRQYMAALDFWIVVILVLLLASLASSKFEPLKEAIVVAVVVGSVGMVWLGRIDVLIHRPVPAIKSIESQIDHVMESLPGTEIVKIRFLGWESYYKRQIKTGVKILIPLDAIAGILIFLLFMYANNHAYMFLQGEWWRNYFWWGAFLVHLLGWGIIASAKTIAE